jgi:phosphoribosylaminoimidazole-succinocarboxamide synthase
MIRADLDGLKIFNRGKVRDIFDLGDRLLIVATDRISAFDVVLPDPVPDKGRVLTGLSDFWFDFLKQVPNHRITSDVARMPPEVQRHREALGGRAMLVHKARPFPVECVVRGYLTGSGLKDYKKTGAVCGIPLPSGLRESDRLPEPIFTPATKATTGHDENIPFSRVTALVGKATAEKLRDLSFKIYNAAAEYAHERGLILCDTKFEFGERDGEILLIDEALTPDSSRYWPLADYEPGRPQHAFDKQYVRDYLEKIGWDKNPPGPRLPPEVIENTRRRYREAYRQLVGQDLD